ncbi:hypothetical protein MMC30_006445 [Trapelia coarctata]|nr:hypothetical protein [Trapelia coarctata]
MSSLSALYPWTHSPLLINAPMAGFAGSALAAAVSKAHGFGFIGSAFDMSALATALEEASQLFFNAPVPPEGEELPIGFGVLIFLVKAEAVVPLVQKFRPAAVWLFGAGELEEYGVWADKVRGVSGTRVWVQIGSVAGAVRVAEVARPDVLVLQGLDAGGHGWEKGAGIVSLFPEAQDALVEKGFGHIHLCAAGGIADGRGVAAALALGAEGVVMGTRFLSAPETTAPTQGHREAILRTSDGGQNTVRAKVFDEVRGPNVWPVLFDGRGVVTDSYTDFAGGGGIEEVRRLYKEAVEGEGKGFAEGNRRVTVWAGTGVGLVRRIQPAREIVEEVREGARAALQRAKERL